MQHCGQYCPVFCPHRPFVVDSYQPLQKQHCAGSFEEVRMQNIKDDHHLFHDFGDGNGPVPAHRHVFGGGWVADSAHVEDTVYIGENARVFDHAILKGEAIVTEDAEVSGYAVIKDMASIKGRAVIRGSCTVMGNAEISGNVFIASHITVGGYTVLDREQSSFSARDCLQCPALLDENYGSTRANACLYCLEKLKTKKNIINDSRRETIRTWLPKEGGINQNIDAETQTPQKSGTDNP